MLKHFCDVSKNQNTIPKTKDSGQKKGNVFDSDMNAVVIKLKHNFSSNELCS